MTAKTAYQFDHAGLLVGTTDADESPLEPGVFLLPTRCTFLKPPRRIPNGKWPRFNGVKWAMVSRPTQRETENPLAKLQAFLQANPDVADLLNTGGV